MYKKCKWYKLEKLIMRHPEPETEQSCVLDREHREKMSKATDVLYLISVEFLNPY